MVSGFSSQHFQVLPTSIACTKPFGMAGEYLGWFWVNFWKLGLFYGVFFLFHPISMDGVRASSSENQLAHDLTGRAAQFFRMWGFRWSPSVWDRLLEDSSKTNEIMTCEAKTHVDCLESNGSQGFPSLQARHAGGSGHCTTSIGSLTLNEVLIFCTFFCFLFCLLYFDYFGYHCMAIREASCPWFQIWFLSFLFLTILCNTLRLFFTTL